MSLLCRLFGHKPPKDFSPFATMGGGNYLRLERGCYVDGIGRGHRGVFGECPRCSKTYKVGMMHTDEHGAAK